MRTLVLALAGLLALIQYPLWLGKGGWARAWENGRQLAAAKARNEALVVRNAALDAEVRDLKQGLEAVEERARFELGMVRRNEVFFQIIDAPRPPAAR